MGSSRPANTLLQFDYMSELTPEVPTGCGRIPIQEFVSRSWIGEEMDRLWVENYRKNRPLNLYHVTNEGIGKVVVLVGASPAIKKNWQALKRCDDRFIIVACNGVAKFLVENGVRVDYVFAVEARDHIAPDLDFDAKGAVLVASPFVSPKALEVWRGPRHHYLLGGRDKYQEELKADWSEARIDIGGGNVVSTGFLWAYKYLGSRDFIFAGMSLCYYDDYYHDGRSTKHVDNDISRWKGWYRALDMHGQLVDTTPSLTMYKTWLETYLKPEYTQANITNSTEDGILGVYPEPMEVEGNLMFQTKYLPWMNIIPLRAAILGYIMLMDKKEND